MVESVGNYLRRERELRKITLEEVSEQTRIQLQYLQAIESEHFEKIPGLTFARGYLRAYADYIGLLPEDVLLRFEDFLNKLSGNRPAPPPVSNRRVYGTILFLIIFTAVVFVILWVQKK